MSELVNDTAKTQLSSSRNQEPTHLGGTSYATLGGPGVTGAEPNTVKIDAAQGVGTDTTIPKSVPAEGSHLKTATSTVAEDDVEVSFDDDDKVNEDDDLDAALDKFDEADVDVELKEDDEDEKLDEADDDDKPAFLQKEDDEDGDKDKVNEDDDEDKKVNEDDDEDDKDKVNEDDDEDDKDKVNESKVRIRLNVPAIKLNESVIPAKSQKKVTALFEQALKATTKSVSKQLAEHYRKLYKQKVALHEAALAKQVDGYLTYAVNEWVKDNKVAIRASLRTQLAEEFLTGLQKLMKEHYIDVPESKVDVVKQLQAQLVKANRALNEQTGKTMKVRKLAEEANKRRIVAEAAAGLSEASRAKLSKLAEDVKYTNSKDFKQKLAVLKENYIASKAAPKKKTLAEETIVVPETAKKNEAVAADPLVSAAAAALSSTTSKW